MYGRDMSWQAFVLLVVLFASMGNATRPASVVAGSVPAASADGVRALLERGAETTPAIHGGRPGR